jgi:3-oxoacyl-[acyl-carrier protein] reductase
MATPNLGTATALLQGKTALVTGGSRGIGRAISLQLARKGLTSIAVTYVKNKTAAEEVAAQCLSLGVTKAITISADILDPEIGPNLIKQVLTGLETKNIDIIVNNAAIIDLRLFEPLAKTTTETFQKLMQGNVFAAMSIVNASLEHLPARNGRIINISSGVSREGPPDPLFTYAASKAALESVTRSMAMNLAQKYLCTFNSVSVGATRTDTMEEAINTGTFSPEFIETIGNRSTAEKRVGVPEDVAMIVGFLASEESRWINGSWVMANGGDRAMIPVQG